MTHKRFDRHEDMSNETREEIMNIITETRDEMLKNNLFGLFDGYFYNDTLELGKSVLSEETFERLQSVIETIETYPTLK